MPTEEELEAIIDRSSTRAAAAVKAKAHKAACAGGQLPARCQPALLVRARPAVPPASSCRHAVGSLAQRVKDAPFLWGALFDLPSRALATAVVVAPLLQRPLGRRR